jgi:hypothetical protein
VGGRRLRDAGGYGGALNAPREAAALDQVRTAGPRQPKPERAYAYAGAASGVNLDLGTHGGGKGGNGNGKNEDAGDLEFETY